MDSLPLEFGAKAAAKTVDISKIESTQRKNRPTEGGIDEYTHGDPTASSSALPVVPGESDSADDQSDEDDGPRWEPPQDREGSDLPVTHEIVMKDHSKTVSALSLDPSGTRVISGSYDYDAKLWDFGGMNAAFKPFRSWEVKEGHQIHDVQFSLSGDSILVANGSNQAKLFDRNGIEMLEFNHGDVYMRDLRNTNGHTAALSAIAWHPKNPSLFLTASADSTLRIWDISNKRASKSVIVVKSKERGGRTKVTACAWSPDGKTIGATCEDGSIHLWSASGTFARPNASVEGAHTKGTTTSCIVFTRDGKQVATRGGDNTVKLWDTKSLKKPLFVAENLPSQNPETNLIFSPDEKFILTGTAGAQAGVLAGTADEERAREAKASGKEGGKVAVLRREGLEVVRTLNISPYSVVRVLWHSKINQILTGSSDGSLHVLYSPLTSLKGATLAITRAPKARALDDFATELDRPIITPHSLPMFKEDFGAASAGGRGGKRRREKDRMDPVKTLRPLPPVEGRGRGGRVGASAMQHVVQGMMNANGQDDPREALLKYADGAESEFTKMWEKNAPKPIYDLRPVDDAEDVARAANVAARARREANR